jgi:hypothetical protein
MLVVIISQTQESNAILRQMITHAQNMKNLTYIFFILLS